MPEVMQVTDYYPFGLVMNQENYFADGVLDNKYLYNNKGLQDEELAVEPQSSIAFTFFSFYTFLY